MPSEQLNTQPDNRRFSVLQFAGPATTDAEMPISGRIFPESGSLASWYLHESNPQVRTDIRKWTEAVKKICNVKALGEIKSLFGEEARKNGVSFSQEQENKLAIYERYRDAFAQRHRITISNYPHSEIDYGLVLENTRNGEGVTMTEEAVDNLILDSINWGKSVNHYLTNRHTGIFRGLINILPGHVNEPQGITSPVDFLLYIFSDKWPRQARFEARQILGLSDMAAEVLLQQRKYTGIKDELFDIFNHHGVFEEKTHGPAEQPVEFLTLHNPRNFAVEGIHILDEDEKYDPHPYIVYNRLGIRKAHNPDDSNLNYLVQLNDEPKGVIQTILKMIRRNTMDPAQIRDIYRMSATFINRGDVELFQEAIEKASLRAGKPLEIVEEENTLDGRKYQALREGNGEIYEGSSDKYQVKRLRLFFLGKEDVSFELSCYTLEAYVNYLLRDSMGIDEYMVKRLIYNKKGRYDASVVEYVLPKDIYGVDFQSHEQALIKGIRTSHREKPFIVNEHQSRIPRKISEEEIAQAVENIAKSIQRPADKALSEDILNSQEWPEVIISIGQNSHSPADTLAKVFGKLDYKRLRFDGTYSEIYAFLKRNNSITRGKRVLLIDDVGMKGDMIRKFKKELNRPFFGKPMETKAAYLILDPNARASQYSDFNGLEFSSQEYVFFPQQLHEFIRIHLNVSGIITRQVEGKIEVLTQIENGGRKKLPGGTLAAEKGDNSTLDTIRREFSEELGTELMLDLMKKIKHKFPIESVVLLDLNKDPSLANKLHLRGYCFDGSAIDISKYDLPSDGDVERLEWVPLEKLKKEIKQEGYLKLLEQIVPENFSDTISQAEKLAS